MTLHDVIALLAAQHEHPELYGRPTRSDREPLPAGCALTWGLITKGTMLEGSPYPHRVFSTLAR